MGKELQMDEFRLSITPWKDSLAVTQEERELLDERWVALVQDPTTALTLDEFRSRMKALRG